MISIRRSADRGYADHGWLQTWHTFSFASYYDPDFMGFRTLRVINQDRVAPAKGFGTHSHEDMEIVTYVLEGQLEHRDSMGNGSRMRHGEVQLMSAGTGVTHSEFNASDRETLELLQMWVLPARAGTKPRYEQKAFDDAELRGRLRLVVSPDGQDGSLTIGQDARLYAARLPAGSRVAHALPAGRAAWLHLARGAVELDGEPLEKGDGAALTGEPRFELAATQDAELVLWELAER